MRLHKDVPFLIGRYYERRTRPGESAGASCTSHASARTRAWHPRARRPRPANVVRPLGFSGPDRAGGGAPVRAECWGRTPWRCAPATTASRSGRGGSCGKGVTPCSDCALRQCCGSALDGTELERSRCGPSTRLSPEARKPARWPQTTAAIAFGPGLSDHVVRTLCESTEGRDGPGIRADSARTAGLAPPRAGDVRRLWHAPARRGPDRRHVAVAHTAGPGRTRGRGETDPRLVTSGRRGAAAARSGGEGRRR
jgi:hypothetical protein